MACESERYDGSCEGCGCGARPKTADEVSAERLLDDHSKSEKVTLVTPEYTYGGEAEQRPVPPVVPHAPFGVPVDMEQPMYEAEEMKAVWVSPNREWNDIMNGTVSSDPAIRKASPIASGVLDYFPAALIEVSKVSKAGNDKHNPGQPLHHARGKSTDHADALLRHLIDRGKVDEETGQRHSAEVAWRALAMLQQELEDEGLAPLPRGARLPDAPGKEDA